MTARNATARVSTHAPFFCDECERVHVGDEHDARTILGTSGVTRFGVAYAWCERERAYHYTAPMPRYALSLQDRTARMMSARPFGRARAIPRNSVRTDVVTDDVRTRSMWTAHHDNANVARTLRGSRVRALAQEGVGI